MLDKKYGELFKLSLELWIIPRANRLGLTTLEIK